MFLNDSTNRNRRKASDPFSQFLFGAHSPQRRERDDEHERISDHSSPQRNYARQRNQNSQLRERNESALINPASIEKYLNNLDVNLLYENIDLLMKTAEQFKPLYNELNPIIMKFLKRNK